MERRQIGQLRLLAQYGKGGEIIAGYGSFNDYFDLLGGDDQEEMENDITRTLALVQSLLECSLESVDK
jgi:hypothetical protein